MATLQATTITGNATCTNIDADNLAGWIAPFASSTVPTGWLACDGASVSTSTYAKLFGKIGHGWGGSGGSFNLPNMNGACCKGAGTSGSSPDYVGPSVAGYQVPQNQSHNHPASSSSSGTGYYGHYTNNQGTSYGDWNRPNMQLGNFKDSPPNGGSWRANIPARNFNLSVSTSTSMSGATSAGNETRVFSVGVKYCIKT